MLYSSVPLHQRQSRVVFWVMKIRYLYCGSIRSSAKFSVGKNKYSIRPDDVHLMLCSNSYSKLPIQRESFRIFVRFRVLRSFIMGTFRGYNRIKS